MGHGGWIYSMAQAMHTFTILKSSFYFGQLTQGGQFAKEKNSILRIWFTRGSGIIIKLS
jgi:hypothetical protein